ncbi:unnamed protein product [Leptosia nina]|uniref:CRAL-TRIO domain-containing protein n=1 Tax=Leptosia nina TaxID=320188 RepID=A0AAV1IZ68_9NEOP
MRSAQGLFFSVYTMVEVKEFPVHEEYKKGTATSDDVAKLRSWLKTQPHLPEEFITDLDIALAYHSCNKSMEVTKQGLDLNFSLRTLFTAYFKDRKFDRTMERTFENTLFVPLPHQTQDGNVVLYSQVLNSDPNEFNVENNIRALLMCIDLWQYETGSWSGLEVVLNFKGYGIGHMPKIDIRNVQQILHYLQEAIPLKLKKLHLVNAPSFFDRLLSIMRPFINNEILNIVEVYSDGFKNIVKNIPLEVFPKDVGGHYKTVKELNDEVIKKLHSSSSFFEAENKKRVVESLRPGKPKNYSNMFGGVEGSFKKLDID